MNKSTITITSLAIAALLFAGAGCELQNRGQSDLNVNGQPDEHMQEDQMQDEHMDDKMNDEMDDMDMDDKNDDHMEAATRIEVQLEKLEANFEDLNTRLNENTSISTEARTNIEAAQASAQEALNAAKARLETMQEAGEEAQVEAKLRTEAAIEAAQEAFNLFKERLNAQVNTKADANIGVEIED